MDNVFDVWPWYDREMGRPRSRQSDNVYYSLFAKLYQIKLISFI